MCIKYCLKQIFIILIVYITLICDSLAYDTYINITSPSSGTVINGSSVTVYWATDYVPCGYYIDVSYDVNFNPNLTTTDYYSYYTYGYITSIIINSIPVSVSPLYIRIRADFCTSNSITSSTTSVYRLPTAPPNTPTLYSASGDTVVNFNWSSELATKYELSVGYDSNFSSLKCFGEVATNGTFCDNFLDNGHTYYWKVRAFNANGWSGYSTVNSFVNGPSAPPDVPNAFAPSDGSFVPGTSVIFGLTAQNLRVANQYLMVAKDSEFANIYFSNYVGIGPMYTLPFLYNGQKYYWKVAAWNSRGWSEYSPARSFVNDCEPQIGNSSSGPVDTCYDSKVPTYFLKDISRRANINPFGHNGRMANNASISAQLYNTFGPMEDTDNIWSDSEQSSGVNAQVNASKVYDYLLTHFGLNSFDKNGSSMISIVEDAGILNGVNCYNNAAWTGALVRYCIGYPNSSKLDVVGHEWGHAVTQKASNRQSYLSQINDEAGALDEAFSDWVGAAVAVANGPYSWIYAEGAPSYRNFANPRLSYPAQPDTYGGENWSWSNDVHINCGVPNKMFKILSDAIGIEKAIQIAYYANMNLWDAGLTFKEARTDMIQAARDIFGSTSSEAEQVKNAWAAVHVTELRTPDVLKAIQALPAILLPLLLNL